MMPKSYKDLLAEANAAVETYPIAEGLACVNDSEIVFVDLRDHPELERDGKIPGAVHATRGMLEFLVDPESPYHNPVFSSGKKIMFYCASGGRSALAAKTVQEMGLTNVAHLGGGFNAWRNAGGATEQA